VELAKSKCAGSIESADIPLAKVNAFIWANFIGDQVAKGGMVRTSGRIPSGTIVRAQLPTMASTTSPLLKRIKPTSFTIPLPHDFHHHFRDDGRLATVAQIVSTKYAKVLAMPNLTPPICTVEQALSYRQRILAHSLSKDFDPLMTLYLTDLTQVQEIEKMPLTKVVACKLYPQGATTNSHFGVTNVTKLTEVLQKMSDLGIILCVHGEQVGPQIDPFDRERLFIEQELQWLITTFPKLKIVLEHITTKEAVEFVLQAGDNVAATITPQHLVYDRSALFSSAGFRPHLYCLPILKRGNPHRLALLGAIASGNKKFFLGTDSAPHVQMEKEKDCGCAGCFSAFNALELYLEAFEEVDSLPMFENFACHYGPHFYNLQGDQSTTKRILCERKELQVPKDFKSEAGPIIPLRAGTVCNWTTTLL
jgi:dihydroorotase